MARFVGSSRRRRIKGAIHHATSAFAGVMLRVGPAEMDIAHHTGG